MKKIGSKKLLSLFLVVMMLFSVMPLMPPEAQAAEAYVKGTGPVVIYEAYGGGGNSKDVYSYDYIVLRNISDVPVDLNGWTIQRASPTGTFANGSSHALSGTIAANAFYFIKGTSQSQNPNKPIPDYIEVNADFSTSNKLNLAAAEFKIALANSDVKVEKSTDNHVIDFLGAGRRASDYLGESAPAASSQKSVQRIAYTGNNAKDYSLVTPNLAYFLPETPTDPTDPDPEEPVTPDFITISAARSAAANETVHTKGIITHIDARNIIIQDDTAGICARIGANDATLALGDELNITGTRDTYRNLEQINVTDYMKVSSGNTLPAAQEVTLASLLADAESYESERVYIKEAVLGTIDTSVNGNTNLTQGDVTLPIFRIHQAGTINASGGDTVNVTAVVGQFDKTYQLRVAQSSDIDKVGAGEPQEPEPTPDVISIAEARAKALGETATIAGVVTFADRQSITIQDDTAGIVVRLSAYDGAIRIGDKLEATGSLADYQGLLQLNETEYRMLSSGNDLPAPKIMTLAALLEAAEAYESQRVRIENADLGVVNTGGNTPLTQGSDSLNLYRMPALQGIDDYDTVNVTGILSQYNSYQLRVVQAGDVELVQSNDLEPLPPTDVEDPISEDMEAAYGAMNIKEVLVQPADTDVTVIGVVAYTYGGGNSLIIQDVIDGQIVGYQIYGPTENTEPGDIVVVSGKHILYYGLPELSNVSSMEVVAQTTPFDPQVVTADHLKKYMHDYMNEYVMIKDVTLPEYKADGTITFKDPTGTIDTYRAPAYPMGTIIGDPIYGVVDIEAAMSSHNGAPQVRLGDTRDYKVSPDETLEPVISPVGMPTAKAGQDYVFTVEVIDNAAIDQVDFFAVVGDRKTDPIAMTHTVGNHYQGVVPGADIVGADEMTLALTALDVNGNEGRLQQTVAIDNRPAITQVQPAPNTETGADQRPVIQVTFTNAGENPKVQLRLNDASPVDMVVAGNTARYTPLADLPDGRITASAVVTREEDNTESAPYDWSFHIGEAATRLYFGQIHSHTNYSDGAGTLEEAMAYARNAEQIDFFALTDHSNYFDTANDLGTMDNENSGLMDPNEPDKYKWARYKEVIESYASADFLPFYGFEMTWTKSGANYGHMNTYLSEGFVSRNDPFYNDKTNSQGLLRYYDLLTQHPATFSQFNHPGSTFGTFDDFAHYDPRYDAMIHLIEVGNGEGAVGSNGYWPSYNYYTMALDKGWHLAPSNNQDNHKGKWGDANTTRTVVLADSLSKAGITEAIKAYRVYATEDHNLEIQYSVNDAPMGSIITDAQENLRFDVMIQDPDPSDIIGQVEVISNGGVVTHQQKLNSNSANLTFDLPNDKTYYYLRITQVDGDIAVTAPVWTDTLVQVGIDSITKNTQVEYVGEDTELTTTFVNGSDTELPIQRVEYSVLTADGAESLLVVDSNLPRVEAGGQATFTHTLQPRHTGKQAVRVSVYPDDGNPYTETITWNVYDKSAAVTPIVEVQKAVEGQPFVIEGTLTSNASGYDKNTAFFDSAYVQDATGGINIFPIANDYQEGQRVRITGTTSSYQGEHQLNVALIEAIDGPLAPIAPAIVQTGEVSDHLGSLIKTTGSVLSVEKTGEVIDAIRIDDGSGPIRIFIDGYIGKTMSPDKSMPDIQRGDTLSVTGLSSLDPEGSRIRVRNRDEVILDTSGKPDPTEDTTAPVISGVRDRTVALHSRIDVLEGISARDDRDGLVSVKASPDHVDTSVAGKTQIMLTAIDQAGNTTIETFTITVQEPAPPQPPAREPQKNRDPNYGVTINDSPRDDGASDSPLPTTPPPHPAPKDPEVPQDPDHHWANPFTDVQPEDWYYNSVRNVVMQGLMVGTTETIFAPLETTNRAMVVTLLHRLSAAPPVLSENPFEDVAPDAWYATPVTWAHENGIADGYAPTLFGPEDPVTREQLAAFLMKYAAFRNIDTEERASLDPFTDAKQISPWAEETIAWAVAEGILGGRTDGSLDPQGTATRAETAAMIERFASLLADD